MNEQALQRKTMIAFLFQGIFFFVGYSFLDVNTVIPIFIETLTGKVELAGIASTIRQGATLSVQLILGAYIMKVRNVPQYISVMMAVGYAAPLLILPALFFEAGTALLAMVTFVSIGIMWSADGLIVIGYYDLLGRTVSGANRSRVLGFSQLFGGGGAIVATLLIKLILDHQELTIQSKYILIFSLGSGILLLGALAMSRAKDLPHRQPVQAFCLKQQLAKIPDLCKKNRPFRQCMYCQICFTIAMMSAPFVLILCKNRLGLPENFISTLLNLQVLGTVLGGGISALLGPRLGNRFVLLLYCFITLSTGVTGLLVLLGVGNPFLMSIIMVITTGLSAASWIGFMNAIIDVTPMENRPIFMIINSLVTLPLAAVGILGGQLIKYLGYTAFLAISTCFALSAVLLAIKFYKNGKDVTYV